MRTGGLAQGSSSGWVAGPAEGVEQPAASDASAASAYAGGRVAARAAQWPAGVPVHSVAATGGSFSAATGGGGGAPSPAIDFQTQWRRWRESVVGFWDHLNIWDTEGTRKKRHDWAPGNMDINVYMRILGNNLGGIGAAAPFPYPWRPFWDASTASYLERDVPFPFPPPMGVPGGVKLLSVGNKKFIRRQ